MNSRRQEDHNNNNMMMMEEEEDEGTSNYFADNNNNNEDYEEPAYIDETDAIEVQGINDDDDVPMDDDDDDDEDDDVGALEEAQGPNNSGSSSLAVVHDMAQIKLTSHHTGPIYTVASHIDHDNNNNSNLTVISGGGDDRAFLHKIPLTAAAAPPPATTTTTRTIPLEFPHKDSVSCVATNVDFIEHAPAPAVGSGVAATPKLIAVGSYDGAIVVYNYDTGAFVKELEGPSDIEWVCFHPKGGTVLLAGSMADGTLWMYHVGTWKCLQVFVGHQAGVVAGGFSESGKVAVSASVDGTLRVWAPRTGLSKHVFNFDSTSSKHQGEADAAAPLTCMAFQKDGPLVLVGTEHGTAHVCHLGTKKIVASLRHFDETTTGSGIMQQDNNENEDEFLEPPRSVEAVGFACKHDTNTTTNSNNWCATGGVNGVLKIWDLANTPPACRQECRAASTTTDEKNAAAATAPGITNLAWHSNSYHVVTAHSDGTARLWDARSGALLREMTGHSDVINAMSVLEYNNSTFLAVTGSDDKTVRVFDMYRSNDTQTSATTQQPTTDLVLQPQQHESMDT